MRTYYCIEMGAATYPAGEILCQSRPFKDKRTNEFAARVRANTKAEAIEICREAMNAEREKALQAELGETT